MVRGRHIGYSDVGAPSNASKLGTDLSFKVKMNTQLEKEHTRHVKVKTNVCLVHH